MKSGKNSSHPPKARLVLRIGVTGHRLNNLPSDQNALTEEVLMVLLGIQNALIALSSESEIKSAYRDEAPLIRIISPLAEGADRIVAEQGLALGFELQCPLPFLRDQYADDFQSADSSQAYYEFLDQATAVFELDGDRTTVANRQHAYEAVGRLVVRHSDLLVAIWNGKPAEGQGGTGDIVELALRQALPVIQIDPESPDHSSWLKLDADRKIKQHHVASLTNLIYEIIVPPKDKNQLLSDRHANDEYDEQKGNSRLHYFEESRPKDKHWNACYRCFVKFMSCQLLTLMKSRLTTGQKQANEHTCKEKNRQNTSIDLIDKIVEQLNLHYEWADSLANYYAKHYRSAFVLAYLLSAMVVLLPLMSHLFDTLNYETNIFQVNILILGEFLVVCMIYLLIDKGGKNNWHRRWIEYRLLAETFRLTMLLLPLGGVAPRLKVPAHDSQDNPANSWVHWHARSVAREAGLPEIQCDAEFRDTYQKHLIGIISEQVEYHKNLSDCGKKVTHCIHTIGMVFFIVILIFCALHLFEGVLKPLLAKLKLGVENWYPPEALSLLITAFLPALGAALAGILTQGEFYRIERRSKAMAEQLQVIVEKLRKDENYSIEQLASLAESAAETIITEVLDWRVVFLAKPLERPT